MHYSKIVNQVGRSLPGNPVVPKLRALVDEFKLTVPVIQCLRNPTLQKHHHQAIDEIVGREISRDPDYTLGVLIELKVWDGGTGGGGGATPRVLGRQLPLPPPSPRRGLRPTVSWGGSWRPEPRGLPPPGMEDFRLLGCWYSLRRVAQECSSVGVLWCRGAVPMKLKMCGTGRCSAAVLQERNVCEAEC